MRRKMVNSQKDMAVAARPRTRPITTQGKHKNKNNQRNNTNKDKNRLTGWPRPVSPPSAATAANTAATAVTATTAAFTPRRYPSPSTFHWTGRLYLLLSLFLCVSLWFLKALAVADRGGAIVTHQHIKHTQTPRLSRSMLKRLRKHYSLLYKRKHVHNSV